jgi:hypothetical protein
MNRTLIALVAATLPLAACSLGTTPSPSDAEAGSGSSTSTSSTVSSPTTSTSPTSSTSSAPDATTSTTEGEAGECPVDDFLIDEVNAYVSTQGYPDPELAVTCTTDTLVVTSNGIPAFEFESVTPNGLTEQDLTYEIPLDPEWLDDPLALGLGTIGVSIDGLALFGAFEAPRDGYRDPMSDGLLDDCNGHTAPGGLYHYHAGLGCMEDADMEAGMVVGYLNDGYEIVVDPEVTSSYVRVDETDLGAFTAWEYQDGAGDLDECSGRLDDDGVYRYYATDTFPYLPFCYHGATDAAAGTFTGDPPAG